MKKKHGMEKKRGRKKKESGKLKEPRKKPRKRRLHMSEYLRNHKEKPRYTRDIHILAIGPKDCDEQDYVFDTLDHYLKKYDKVIIHDNCIPGKEYNRHPENWSNFPLAALWTFKRFQTVIKHHAPFSGKKQKRKGIKYQLIDQLKNVDKVVVFRDFEDKWIENVIDKAKQLKIPVIEKRI